MVQGARWFRATLISTSIPERLLHRPMTETGPVTQLRNMWHTLLGGVPKDTILKARVDEDLAQAVDAWAEEHGTDRSEAIRLALRRLLEDEDARQRRIQEARDAIEALAETGIFDEPEDDSWKASGGWA